MFRKFAKRSAVYHIKNNNIENLKIRLTFQRVDSLLKIPKFNPEPNENDDRSATSKVIHSDGNSGSDENGVEIVNIQWQQKIFSKFEREIYKDLANCTTDVHRKYHDLLLNTEDEEKEYERMSKRRSGKSRQRRKIPETCQKSVISTYVNEDNFIVPEEENFHVNAKRSNPEDDDTEVMYIYAALNPDTLLFSLKWHPNEGTLYVYPDFTNFHEPYFIEIDTDYRHLYAYYVENISSKCQNHALQQQNPIGIPSDWQETDSELSKKFDMPPKHQRRIVILFEIRDGHGFQYDNIHVRYHIKLPDQITIESGQLSGCTHTSSSIASQTGRCHFGFTWQLEVLCAETFSWDQMCRIFFEIISIDSWDRERIEGYSHFSFFLQAGKDEQRCLNCVRPAEDFFDSLNRYFIGGRKKFDYENFFNNHADNFLNGYQCKTETTGNITISCQRLCQRYPSVLRSCASSSRQSGMTLDDIMKAYRQARQRLELMVLEKKDK